MADHLNSSTQGRPRYLPSPRTALVLFLLIGCTLVVGAAALSYFFPCRNRFECLKVALTAMMLALPGCFCLMMAFVSGGKSEFQGDRVRISSFLFRKVLALSELKSIIRARTLGREVITLGFDKRISVNFPPWHEDFIKVKNYLVESGLIDPLAFPFAPAVDGQIASNTGGGPASSKRRFPWRPNAKIAPAVKVALVGGIVTVVLMLVSFIIMTLATSGDRDFMYLGVAFALGFGVAGVWLVVKKLRTRGRSRHATYDGNTLTICDGFSEFQVPTERIRKIALCADEHFKGEAASVRWGLFGSRYLPVDEPRVLIESIVTDHPRLLEKLVWREKTEVKNLTTSQREEVHRNMTAD